MSGLQTQFSGVLCFRSSHMLQSRCWLGPYSHQRSTQEGTASFPSSSRCWLAGFLSLWVLRLSVSDSLYVWGPPLLLCHVHLSQMAMASSAPASLEGKTENAWEMEVTIFAKLISEWHLIPFAAFSLFKQAVWSSPHLRGGGCIKGKILGSCLPHPVLTSWRLLIRIF